MPQPIPTVKITVSTIVRFRALTPQAGERDMHGRESAETEQEQAEAAERDVTDRPERHRAVRVGGRAMDLDPFDPAAPHQDPDVVPGESARTTPYEESKTILGYPPTHRPVPDLPRSVSTTVPGACWTAGSFAANCADSA